MRVFRAWLSGPALVCAPIPRKKFLFSTCALPHCYALWSPDGKMKTQKPLQLGMCSGFVLDLPVFRTPSTIAPTCVITRIFTIYHHQNIDLYQAAARGINFSVPSVPRTLGPAGLRHARSFSNSPVSLSWGFLLQYKRDAVEAAVREIAQDREAFAEGRREAVKRIGEKCS